MAMSRKHYNEIAAIVRSEREEWEGNLQVQNALNGVASELASFFARDNGNFDRQRFLAAAGLAGASK